MEWTKDEDADLARRWNAGDSSGAIGRDLGRTRNSIVGRKNRLGLGNRPSPIRPKGEPKPPKAPRAPRVAPTLVIVEAPKPVRVSSCCWPFDIPGTRKFRFCEAAVCERSPYCEEHRKRAYLHYRIAA